MNKHIPKVLKGIGIAFVLTLVIYVIGYTLFELAVYWDHHVNVARNRFGNWGFIKPFMELWFLHSCYCVADELIPIAKRDKLNYAYLWLPFSCLLGAFLLEERSLIIDVMKYSILSVPSTILLRGLLEKLTRGIKLKELILNWKTMYVIWFVYLIMIGLMKNNRYFFFSFIEILFIIKIIGCGVFAVAGCCWLWRKQWLNAIMFFIPICFKTFISLIYKL